MCEYRRCWFSDDANLRPKPPQRAFDRERLLTGGNDAIRSRRPPPSDIQGI